MCVSCSAAILAVLGSETGLRPADRSQTGLSDRPRSWSWSCSFGLDLGIGVIYTKYIYLLPLNSLFDSHCLRYNIQRPIVRCCLLRHWILSKEDWTSSGVTIAILWIRACLHRDSQWTANRSLWPNIKGWRRRFQGFKDIKFVDIRRHSPECASNDSCVVKTASFRALLYYRLSPRNVLSWMTFSGHLKPASTKCWRLTRCLFPLLSFFFAS